MDWGAVIPKVDSTIVAKNPEKVIGFLPDILQKELEKRFHHAIEKKDCDVNDVEAAREYVHSMLGFELFSHVTYAFLTGKEEHEESQGGGHGR